MIIKGDLGRIYEDGEVITREGEPGHCMFVVQDGCVEIVRGESTILSVLEKGDVFGEMALFTKHTRSATARARGRARVMTIDKKGFLKRVHQDPSVAFRILRRLSERIRSLNDEVVRLRSGGEQAAH